MYPKATFMSLTASLRRSFRYRKDRQGSPGEAHTPDANHTEFLIYEEVAQYFPRPGERPRLITLIGSSIGVNFNSNETTVVMRNSDTGITGYECHGTFGILI